VWLWRTGRPVWFALLPAVFMLVSTGTALVLNFRDFLKQYRLVQATPTAINMGVAVVLFALAALVVVEALRVWSKGRAEPIPVEPVTA
jgi:carbon starvation protein